MAELTDSELADIYNQFWNNGNTLAELAAHLNLNKSTLNHRANRLRKLGYSLPPFKNSNRAYKTEDGQIITLTEIQEIYLDVAARGGWWAEVLERTNLSAAWLSQSLTKLKRRGVDLPKIKVGKVSDKRKQFIAAHAEALENGHTAQWVIERLGITKIAYKKAVIRHGLQPLKWAKSTAPRKPYAKRKPIEKPPTEKDIAKKKRDEEKLFLQTLKQVAENGGDLNDLSEQLGLTRAQIISAYQQLEKKHGPLPKLNKKAAATSANSTEKK